MKANVKIIIMLAGYAIYLFILFVILLTVGTIGSTNILPIITNIATLILITLNAILIGRRRVSISIFFISIAIAFINSLIMLPSMWAFHPIFLINFYLIFTYTDLLIFVGVERNVQSRYLGVKRKILNISTRYNQLAVDEIAEKCRVRSMIVKKLIDDMISNDELKAKYDMNTGLVEFDRTANVREIDELLEKYREWETDKIGKWKE